MKMLIALVVCALFSTSSFSSSTGTSANDKTQDLTQSVTDILSGDDSTSSTAFSICVNKHKKRCLNSYTQIQCRRILTKYCSRDQVSDVVRHCIKSNLKRCLTNFSVKKCRVLLTNACSISDDKKWDRLCVKKYAPRCVYNMLTRRECLVALEPICKK